MNYEANTIGWWPGSIVLHDADEKSPRMLMEVLETDPSTELVTTRYILRDKAHKRQWKNDLKYLHDPNRFGINPQLGRLVPCYLIQAQNEWELVRWWNHHHKPGLPVTVSGGDGNFKTITTSEAFFSADGHAQIKLQDGGWWSLKFVESIKSA